MLTAPSVPGAHPARFVARRPGTDGPRLSRLGGQAAEPGRTCILVVVEMTGGNDGLNMCHPLRRRPLPGRPPRAPPLRGPGRPRRRPDRPEPGDARSFQEAPLRRPARDRARGRLPQPRPVALRVDGHLADGRPHALRSAAAGWAEALTRSGSPPARSPESTLEPQQLPLAMRRVRPPACRRSTRASPATSTSPPNLPTTTAASPPRLPRASRGTTPRSTRTRPPAEAMIEDLAKLSPARDDLRQVRPAHLLLQTYATIEDLRKVTNADRSNGRPGFRTSLSGGSGNGELASEPALVGNMIAAGFGTRIFYVSIAGSTPTPTSFRSTSHLLQQLANAIAGFFNQLDRSGHCRAGCAL